MFELLTGTRLSEMVHVKRRWEGLTVLFHFRNALGHGREVVAGKISAYYIKEPWREVFKGSYRHVEDYLLKKRLLNAKFTDQHSDFLFLGDVIADHFRDLALSLPAAIIRSLPVEESREVQVVLASLR